MNHAWLVNRHIVMWMMMAHFISLMMLLEYTPWWILPFSGIVIGWRWLYVIGKVSVFNKFAHYALTITAIGMLALSGMNSGMLENMVNLLLLSYGLKFIELRKLRDVLILVSVGFITIAIVFIYNESLMTTIGASFLVLIQLSILVALHTPDLSWLKQVKVALKISALSLPLTIVLFIIMPQLGPLWSMSAASGATTGLSDSMSPGDIANLRGSDALVFSVIFDGEVIPPSQRYWRALVLDKFDGRQWQQRVTPSRWQSYQDEIQWPDLSNEPNFSYKIIAKSSNQRWLFGINIATSNDDKVNQVADFTLKYTKPIISTTAYDVVSYPELASKLSLSSGQIKYNLSTPKKGNEETKRWVEKQRIKFPNDHQFVQFILQHFNQESFFYTLNPPLLGDNSVDEFMFVTRQGFCSHYASAFSLIMRYAGIPSRVVTGYQGGEWNEEIGYLNVYQYDAHAWNEIWIKGKGWLRVDPTASINPERIISTLEDVDNEPFFGGNKLSLIRYRDNDFLNELRLSLANIEFYWSRWVVEYDDEKQQQLLEMLLGKLTGTKVMGFIIIVFSMIGLMLWWQTGYIFNFRRKTQQQRVDQLYLRMIKHMEKHDVKRELHMSPTAYKEIIITKYPHINKEIQSFTSLYNTIRYKQNTPVTKQQVLELKSLLHVLFKKL